MANFKSQKMRNLTNAKAHERNKAVRTELKTRVKAADASIGTDSNEDDVRAAIKRIDMAVSKGVIHKHAGARKKSRLMRKVNASAS